VLKAIMSIGNLYFPESLYKMYLVNAPFIFTAIWKMISPWIHPITKAKIRIVKSKEEAMKKMKGDGMAMEVIPSFLGGESEGVDSGTMIRSVIAASSNGENEDPRASWPDHERQALAPTVVKRRGYHNSVYSSDATPFVAACGWLEKRGVDGYILSGSWIKRWFKSNNEYLNYYDEEDGELLGSYNLKKMISVDKTGDLEFTITFRSGEKKRFRLVVASDENKEEEAQDTKRRRSSMFTNNVEQWVKDLRERKEWFEDIWDATESELKMKDEQNRKKLKDEASRLEEEEKKSLERRRAQIKGSNGSSGSSSRAICRCNSVTAGIWIGATVVMVSAVVFGFLSQV